MKIRTYTELMRIPTFEERFEYLKLNGSVGRDTFGFDRMFYQRFLKSREWLNLRDFVIYRDNGCDLGVEGHEINGQKIYIHHMNPSTMDDLQHNAEILLDPEYLITTIHKTHNAIHYGDASLLDKAPIVRRKNDTCPWRQ